MARGVNKVILIGNLGNDPETRYSPNGSAVSNFNVATDESYKDKNTGQMVPKTEWHRVVMFGKLAEIAGQYLKKGSKVYLEGKLQTREWEKDGIKRYTTEIVVGIDGTMQMLDGRGEGGQGGGNYGEGGGYGGGSGQRSNARQEAPAAAASAGGYASSANSAPIPEPMMDPDDDIPF